MTQGKDVWEKMSPDTPRGIMRVWDAGAVPKNSEVLYGHGQRNADPHMSLFSQDGHGKEARILLTHRLHYISSFINMAFYTDLILGESVSICQQSGVFLQRVKHRAHQQLSYMIN